MQLLINHVSKRGPWPKPGTLFIYWCCLSEIMMCISHYIHSLIKGGITPQLKCWFDSTERKKIGEERRIGNEERKEIEEDIGKYLLKSNYLAIYIFQQTICRVCIPWWIPVSGIKIFCLEGSFKYHFFTRFCVRNSIITIHTCCFGVFDTVATEL